MFATFRSIMDVSSDILVYTPESQLRTPRKLFARMAADLLSSRELAWRMIVRDIQSRYRQTRFGPLWAFLSPAMTAMIFVFLNRQGILNVQTRDIPYPAFVMIGTVLWQLFAESMNAPLRTMGQARSLLTKANFPREALILSAMGQVLFDHAIRCLILVAAFIMFDLPFTWGILWGLASMVFIMLLGMTIGLFLVPLGMLYADVSMALGGVLSLWFYLTPVVYPTPQQWPYSLIQMINPISPLLVGTRDLLATGVLPNAVSYFIVAACSLFGILLAWVCYRVALPVLNDRGDA